MKNDYSLIKWFIVFLSISVFICAFGALFAYANAAQFDFEAILKEDNVDFNEIIFYADSVSCVSEYNSAVSYVSSSKFFPLYKGNDLGGLFEYKNRSFKFYAKCNKNNMIIKIKEQV
ncbi:hypothetical protein [Pseudomonas putida]|uniref:hypothetical protein n=1 Tax=Pseudomonas putida TaxID=303 RepID=UPI000A4240E8|nr:hypothetical protein [Pseudomonas putida]